MTTINMDVVINRADLDRLLDAVEPRVVLKVIGMKLIKYVGESFSTRGRGGWRPLAQSTLDLRKRGGDMPLQDTGRYRQSFISQTDNQTMVEVGSNIKTESGLSLAKIHEFGTGPYTIRVKQARVLAAKTRAGAWMIFGREVHHPGISPRPVLPTVPQAEEMLKPAIEEMLVIARDGT